MTFLDIFVFRHIYSLLFFFTVETAQLLLEVETTQKCLFCSTIHYNAQKKIMQKGQYRMFIFVL